MILTIKKNPLIKLLFSNRNIFSSILFFILTSMPQNSYSSACCGGSVSLPSIITGDNQTQITSTFSQVEFDTYVDASGVWRKKLKKEVSQIFKFDFVEVFNDRYQYGFTVPFKSGLSFESQIHSHYQLGDIGLMLAYEYLTDWDYNIYRPKGIAFISLTAPTGKSKYDILDARDVTGLGVWSASIGSILSKSWLTWDALSSVEFHHFFSRDINNLGIKGQLQPTQAISVSIGGGYNLSNFRLGTALQWSHKKNSEIIGLIPATVESEEVTTASMTMSYLLENQWSASMVYSDQSIFGDPSNTTLGKSISMFIQKRWAR